jgi:predicted RNA-binding protein with PUA-like domain
VRTLPAPVTLDQIKADKRFAGMALVRISRLSVQPVSDAEWRAICKLGGLDEPLTGPRRAGAGGRR